MNFEPLKQFMQHLTDWRIPGNDISVWVENREVFRHVSGYLDVENHIKMEPDHLLDIYSCSKVALAVAGLQLLEKQKIALQNPLYDYIPEFKEMTIKTEDGQVKRAQKPITLWHLFTMTSGMTYSMPDEIKKIAEEKTGGLFNTVETVKCMAEMPLVFEPGEKWNYAFGHDVLAAVIEIVSGKSYSEYVKEHIFAPLGMKNSYFHLPETEKKRRAPLYKFVDEAGETDLVKNQRKESARIGGYIERTDGKNTLVFGEKYDSGGAGIVTTVSDYAKLANALAMGGTGKTGEQILRPETVDLMRTNQLNEAQQQTFEWKHLEGYGYGLGVRTMTHKEACNARSNIGEFGWGGAAGASVYVDPSIRLGVFYAHHMLNPQEDYYQPKLRDVIYECIRP